MLRLTAAETACRESSLPSENVIYLPAESWPFSSAIKTDVIESLLKRAGSIRVKANNRTAAENVSQVLHKTENNFSGHISKQKLILLRNIITFGYYFI